MIVVDVGCNPFGGEEDSIGRLIKRFSPEAVFAFDPLVESSNHFVFGTAVIQRGLVAWTHANGVRFSVDGLRSGVDETNGVPVFPSFDLAEFIRILPDGLILKLNIEGGEYPLLHRIHNFGLDEKLQVAIVQWHSEEESHGNFAPRPELSCPVEDWWLWP